MELSVVIPSYRSEALIKRAIDSAIKEGVAPENIVVVEDGVFDDTASVVRACQGVQLITLQQNRGAQYARNLGLQQVATAYVMFLDADDYVENGLLRGLVDTLDREGADLAIGPWRYEGEGIPIGYPQRNPEVLDNAEWIFSWTRMRFFPPCSVAWRASSLKSIGGWDERLRKNQDGELMIRAFLKRLHVSVSQTGNGVYWQHASPYRVTSAKIDDLLHATEIIFQQLEAWAGSEPESAFPVSYRKALGRYCCVTAWQAFASDRKDAGMQWMARAKRYGFHAKGYNGKTSLLAAFLGVGLSSKVRTGFERYRLLQRARSHA